MKSVLLALWLFVASAEATLSVTSLRLMNADTNQAIAGYDPIPFVGAVVDLATLPSRTNLTIEALTAGGTVGSVKFEWGPGRSRTEDTARWLMCGNAGADLFRCDALRNGFSGTIKATPYAGRNGRGRAGTALSVQLGIVRKTSLTLTLVESPSNTEISTLINGDRTFVDLETHPTMNVRATVDATSGVTVGSVVFTLDGVQRPTENFAPFELFNSQSADFEPWEPRVGLRTIAAVAYSGNNGQGTVVASASTRLRVLPRIPEDDGFYDDDDEYGDDDDLYYQEEETVEE